MTRFTLSVEGSGQATGYADERVLVSLERAQGFGKLPNLPVKRLPVGCRRGGCGVCRIRVLAGPYHCDRMSRDHVSEHEEAEGVVLACAVYPDGDLTLRFEPAQRAKKNGQDDRQS